MVSETQYQYCVSFPSGRAGVLIVYSGATKLEIRLDSAVIPERQGVAPTWRGKHHDKSFGKYEVAYLISHHLRTNAA